MPTFTTGDGRRVTAVTADEMRRVDEVAVEELGPKLLGMMENAGRTLARNAREMLPADGGDAGTVVVLAGNGGNGGGGLCAARHLRNHGITVGVVLDREPDDLTGAAATQYATLDAMDTPVAGDGDDPLDDAGRAIQGAALAVDALVGYSLRGEPRGRVADLVRATDAADRLLSLDVPTGVDATTGERPGVAVEPDRTLTLALPKTGLADVDGRLFLGDIAVPPVVFERAGVEYDSPFAGTDDYWLELSTGARD